MVQFRSLARALCLMSLCGSPAAWAAPVDLVAGLDDRGTPQAQDQFGFEVAASGDYTVVSSWLDDEFGEDAGAVFVYDTRTGALVHTLKDPDPQPFDEFGSAVAIDGHRILIGARQKEVDDPDNPGQVIENAGVVYLFDAVTGTLQKTYENPEPGFNDRFGRSVSIDGNRALVSAYTDTIEGSGFTQSGSVYLLDTETDAVVATYRNPAPRNDGFYGARLDLKGDYAVIGNYRDSSSVSQSGSVEIIDTRTGDILFAPKIDNPEPGPVDFFGWDVAVFGTTALIAASFDNAEASFGGKAFLLDLLTGEVIRSFTGIETEANDVFGLAVALDAAYFAIGAPGDNGAENSIGSVYIYDRLTFELIEVLTAPTPLFGDRFGEALDIDGATLIVGARRDNEAGLSDAGAAYIYQITPSPVPLPAGGLLLLGALGGTLVLRCKRRA